MTIIMGRIEEIHGTWEPDSLPDYYEYMSQNNDQTHPDNFQGVSHLSYGWYVIQDLPADSIHSPIR